MELVTLSRSDFQLEEARIDEVMADAVETITPAAEKRKVQIKLQTEEAWVRLEYDLFKTLLLNLMDNALKSGTDVVFVQGSCETSSTKSRLPTVDVAFLRKILKRSQRLFIW